MEGNMMEAVPESGTGVLIHDFEEGFFDNTVRVSFRIMEIRRCVWIWVGDAPLLANLTAHATRGSDPMPSCSKLIDTARSDFGMLIGNRISKRLKDKMVHFAWSLKQDLTEDPLLGKHLESRLIKELKALGIFEHADRLHVSMNKKYIQNAVNTASVKHRTGASLLKHLRREKDTVLYTSKSKTSRRETVADGYALGWRSSRSAAYLVHLSAELEKGWKREMHEREKETKMSIAVSVLLKELQKLYREGAIVDQYGYAIVIERMFRWKKYRGVLQMGRLLRKERLMPTRVSYLYFILASSEVDPENCAVWTERANADGYSIDDQALAPQLRALSKLGKEKEAWVLYKSARAAGTRMGTAEYHALLYCCTAYAAAQTVWDMMRSSKIGMNSMTVNLVLRACIASVDVQGAENILCKAAEAHIKLNIQTFRALMTLNLKAGRTDEALRILVDMAEHGIQADRQTQVRALKAACDAVTGRDCRYYVLACDIYEGYLEHNKPFLQVYTHLMSVAVNVGDRSFVSRLEGDMVKYGVQPCSDLNRLIRDFLSEKDEGRVAVMSLQDSARSTSSEELIAKPNKLVLFIGNRPSWWKKLVFCIALYNLASVPFRVCLNTPASLIEVLIDLLLDIIMIFEFFCNVMRPPKGVEEKNELRVSNVLINIRSRQAIVELIAIIPLDLVGFGLSKGLLHPAFRLNKMIRVLKLSWYFDELGEILQIGHNAQRVFRFTVLIIWLIYWLGCVWNLVIWSDGETSHTWYWTQQPGLLSEPSGYRFLLGVYWTLTMMTGYGSILPQSDLQIIFSLVTVVVGVAGNVGVIGTLGSLVQNLDSSGAAFRQKMDAVNDYMRYRKISTEMQTRIKGYYTYLWQSRRGLDEARLIQELPGYLQEEVSLFLNKEIISKVPLFHECDEQFKSAVVVKLIPTVLLPDSFIVRKGEVGREMYFISRGEVQVVSEAKESSERVVYATLRDGSFFGEVALLFNDSRRTATVVTSSFCDLFVLRKEDFDTIRESFPDQSKAIHKAAQKRYNLQRQNENAED